MKMNLNKITLILVLLLSFQKAVFSQAPGVLSVPNVTACPCQTMPATPVWNNVGSTNYTLYPPPVGTTPQPFSSSSIGIFNCSPNPVNLTYTLVGTGVYQSAPITQTVTFTLTIAPPAPITITNTVNYCYCTTATLTAPIGGISYSLSGPGGSFTYGSNIMTIPCVTSPGYTGNYTVTSVINGCTVTGNSQINVAPNNQITVNTTSNVCDYPGTTVALTANLANPTPGSFQWYDNQGTPLPNAGNPNHTLTNLTVNHSGVYKVDGSFNYQTITCPASATTQVNVVQTNPVSLSATPNKIVCQGVNLSLSANAANANGYTWTGPGFASSLANPVIAPAVPANSGSYAVVANFNSPFIVCTTSAVINIDVVPVAAPVITMPSSVCQSVTVSGSATVTGATASGYEWTGPYWPASSIQQAGVIMVNVQPNHSGTYFVTAKFTIPGSGVQCASTASAQLNVVPVNSILVVPPGQVCSPTNAFLQAFATGANLYTWVGPNSFNTPGANVWVYYPTTAASGIYTVTAYFGGGNLTCTNTNTVQLTVNTPLNFSLVPRHETCYDRPVTLKGPAGATSYSWTSSTGFTSTNKDVSFNLIQPSDAGTYTLTVMLGPCKTVNSTEVVVYSRVQFSLTPLDRTICKGDTIYLEVGAKGGSENYVYEWNPPVYLESPSMPKQMAIPLSSVVYNVMVHDMACADYWITHSFNVKVNQPPIPNLVLDRTEGCEPLTLFYNTGTQKEAAITTYDFGYGNKGIIQRDSFPHTLSAGSYDLKIYSKGKNGCSGVYEYPVPLVAYPKPGTEVLWSPEFPSTTDEIIFYPVSKNEPVTFYSWSFYGGITPGDTNQSKQPGGTDTSNLKNPVRKYEQFGKYPLVLITQNEHGCFDTVPKVLNIIDEMQIFVPNSFTPNGDGINDLFMAKGQGLKVENFTLDIFTRAGTLVFTTKDIHEGWDGTFKGQVMKDATYVYKIRVVGMNGEGRKEFTGSVTILK